MKPHGQPRRIIPAHEARLPLSEEAAPLKTRWFPLAASVCVLACLLVLVFFQAPAWAFTDVPVQAREYTAVTGLAAKSALDGFPDGTFRPHDDVLRGQLLKMVVEVLHLPADPSSSRDIPAYAAAAVRAGVTEEYATPEGTVDPWEPLTWEEALHVLVRAGERYLPRPLLPPPDSASPPLLGFTTPEREHAARTAAHNGYLRSLDIGQTRATDVLSRREAATLVWNFAVCFG